MTESQTDKSILSSVKSAMQILRLFKTYQNELGVTEISLKTNLPKSTSHRLINTLTKEGFLSKNPRTNRYRLGLALLTLGGVIFTHKVLYRDAFPVIENLVKKLEETAHICLLEKDKVVYLHRIECDHPIRLVTHIGRGNPLHCTAEGLVILAYKEEKIIDKILSLDLYPFTHATTTDSAILKEKLDKIKENGYALEKDSYYDGFVSIAAPIRDYTEDVVSSVAIIGLTTRILEEKYSFYVEEIKGAAKEISKLLGYYKE
jgi:DNA-binding IclR family transcriptional regulator